MANPVEGKVSINVEFDLSELSAWCHHVLTTRYSEYRQDIDWLLIAQKVSVKGDIERLCSGCQDTIEEKIAMEIGFQVGHKPWED